MTVYFIRERGTDNVKIGRTGGRAVLRLPALQTGNPRRLYVAHSIPGGSAVETTLHDLYADRKGDREGEWFEWSDSMMSISNVGDDGQPVVSNGLQALLVVMVVLILAIWCLLWGLR